MRTIRVVVLPGSNSCKAGVIGLHRDRQVRASHAATTWRYDPFARRMLGDFPQAYSHVGLICYALDLARVMSPAAGRAPGFYRRKPKRYRLRSILPSMVRIGVI
jgi:hypothetical protein